MAVTSEHVRALADAYRKTLDEGDVALRGSWLDRKILVAIVVKSATEQSDWLETRVPAGGELKGELEGLISVLVKHDVVGANLASTKKWLSKQMLILIGAVCAFVAWPAWVGIVVAWAGNIFLGAYNFGYWLGLLLGGVVLTWIGRALWAAMTNVYLYGDFRSFFAAPKSIGVRANELFLSHVLPPLEAMRSGHGQVKKKDLVTPIVGELRRWAYVLLGVSIAIFVVVALQFVLGVIAALKCKADSPWTSEVEPCS
ncbi:hypothetical protein J7I97_17570 [Streptomyces sp. ISL-87]|uniref:hypothetical protein n=1 Tax=Streptomyces sp. ISL-87 TaxID=2819188 RepID=UPI001BEA7222|nr:hypothetical protein [Streptomyces sp. ISL-87]MBT2610029.1 hypothetical protein [Streptomyces sp. ISL-87]